MRACAEELRLPLLGLDGVHRRSGELDGQLDAWHATAGADVDNRRRTQLRQQFRAGNAIGDMGREAVEVTAGEQPVGSRTHQFDVLPMQWFHVKRFGGGCQVSPGAALQPDADSAHGQR